MIKSIPTKKSPTIKVSKAFASKLKIEPEEEATNTPRNK